MYLKSIEITGFKSFAKKSELTFSSPISSIVGPNGSGKSNVAEAFRFVLGEQSMKSMRGKKSEDMIWNGSADVPKAGKASVKMVFDNTNKFLPVDFSEVSIERVVHRDGVHEYYINGSQVRLKDIIELLAHAHIGASGHHIISQGEADKILSATPRERKVMIEEALGLKIYQYKKTESLKKLDVTEENIAQVESLRREIAPHIKFLKRQVEKVEKAKELRNELMVVSRQYLKWESEYIQTIQQDIKHKKGPIEEELRRIQDHIERCKQILAREAKDSKRDELMVLEEKMSHTRGRLNECIHDEGRIEGEISAQKRLLIKQKELIQSQSHKTVELRAVEELHVQVQEFLSKLELTEDISIRKHILDSIKNLLTSFTQMHRDTVDVSHISDIEQEIEKLVHSKETISQEIATLKREETHLSGEYQKLKESIEKEKDTNRETEKELFTLLGEKSQKEHLLQTIEYEERTIALREEEYKRDVADLGQLLGREVLQFAHDPKLTDDEAHQHERKRTIERIKIKLEDSPAVGSETIKEYEETVGRDQFLEKELTDLMQSKESLRTLITDLDQKIVTEFTGGVDKINNQFKNYFSLVFGGGEASLEIIREIKRKKKLDDLSGDTEEDEEEGEEGVDIQVSLPKKKVKSLMMLSGGERALTSIALLFAMSQVNPPPFIILDETDAALDEANSRKYGDMIEYLSKVSQLIVITHNRETMSRAGSLFGITMGQGGVSKLLSVSFEDAVTVAK